MLHSQLTIPYTLGVKVPDTTRSFLRLGVSSPQTEPNYQGLAAYRAGPFLFYLLIRTRFVSRELKAMPISPDEIL